MNHINIEKRAQVKFQQHLFVMASQSKCPPAVKQKNKLECILEMEYYATVKQKL